eukprot:TRINITY_DN2541_c0_g1_i3.p1 TRINITY_DN2541_c0_g1~~TRINITY_DN2541_c0_g1_i3.p1  ORF type:complete len:118 (-),score=12.30 TRINITY_DN2541_c0_g1_i3:245-598(-)
MELTASDHRPHCVPSSAMAEGGYKTMPVCPKIKEVNGKGVGKETGEKQRTHFLFFCVSYGNRNMLKNRGDGERTLSVRLCTQRISLCGERERAFQTKKNINQHPPRVVWGLMTLFLY